MSYEGIEDVLSRNYHLKAYLERFVAETGNPPMYITQLSRELRELEDVNVLYPIGDPYFVHITSGDGYWKHYTVIGPEVPQSAYAALRAVEEAIAMRLIDQPIPRTVGEKEELLGKLLDEVIFEDPSLSEDEYKQVKKRGAVRYVVASPSLASAIRYVVLAEKVGMGMLEPLIRDPYIEDVSCDGVGPVFVEHKVFGSCKTNMVFESVEDLDAFVLRLAERAGRPVSVRSPIVDATLPDGSRINIIYGTDISRRGSNFTIRKFSDTPISITQLIKWGTISSLGAAYLWLLLESNLNVWFVGETASGKTTLLRAACAFIRPNAKIVSIEDTPEIVVPHENWVSEVSRTGHDAAEKVELFDLLKAALRQRPNYIIVGEIRGKEAAIAFQAMQCVEDAYVATPSGPLRISELYRQFESSAQGGLVRIPYQLHVYSTGPNALVSKSLCIGVKKLEVNSLILVKFSDGGYLKVTPNHKFLVREENVEQEITAAELLRKWERGYRNFVIATREPPRKGGEEPCEVYCIPVDDHDFWWAMGRLACGDVIRRKGRAYVWIADVRSRDEVRRLTRVIRHCCGTGEVEMRSRRSKFRVVVRRVPPMLVHWMVMNGLLVECGNSYIGTARGLAAVPVSYYIEGAYDALAASRGPNKMRGKEKILGTIEMVSNLAALGLEVACVEIITGTDGGKELERLLSVLESSSIEYVVRKNQRFRGVTIRIAAYRPVRILANGARTRERTEELNYVVERADDPDRIAVESWLKGHRVAVFREYGRAFIYFDQPKELYVTSVVECEGSTVYDLVLEGGGYYLGGMGSCIPVEDTGHGVISTFHAGSVQKLIQRLTGDPIEVPKTYVDNLNAVVIQSAVRIPRTGRLERRVLSINEILGLDPESEGINYIELFSWDPATDSHIFRGEGSSYILENKIAVLKGLGRRGIRKIYEELQKRASFLELLVSKGVFDYRDVFRLVSLATQRGVEETVEEVERGVTA